MEVSAEAEEEGSGSFFVPFPYYLPASRIIVESGRRQVVDESIENNDGLEGDVDESENWYLPKDEGKAPPKKIVLERSPHLAFRK